MHPTHLRRPRPRQHRPGQLLPILFTRNLPLPRFPLRPLPDHFNPLQVPLQPPLILRSTQRHCITQAHSQRIDSDRNAHLRTINNSFHRSTIREILVSGEGPEGLEDDFVVKAEAADFGIVLVSPVEAVLDDGGFDSGVGVEGCEVLELDVGDTEGTDAVGDVGFEGAPGEEGLFGGWHGAVEDEAVEVGVGGVGGCREVFEGGGEGGVDLGGDGVVVIVGHVCGVVGVVGCEFGLDLASVSCSVYW